MSNRGDRSSHRRDSPDDFITNSRGDKKPRASAGLNTYWIDGEGIHREVLQRQICFMLGNEARCKPSSYNVRLGPLDFVSPTDIQKGVTGYNITAVRPFTQRQLDDLIEISTDYVNEKEKFSQDYKREKRTQIPPELPYVESRTAAGYESRRGHDEDLYHQPPRQPPNQIQDYQPHRNQYSYNPNTGPFPPDGPYPSSGPMPPNAFQAPPYGPPNPSQVFPSQRDPYPQQYPPSAYQQPPPRMDPTHPRYMPPTMDMGPPDRGQPPSMYQPNHMVSPPGPQYYQYDDDRMDMDPGPAPQRRGPGPPANYPPPSRMVYDDEDDFRPPKSSKYQIKPPREEDRHRERERDRRDRDKYGRR
ncbi:MAG: hypothetical protein OHK93_003443 [Ramalina farinacea]|uniref:Uncharacterized protein n=1 Tax=Ramalina farinacea TaxID=258253 RepID=A0AA43QT82_9LECA|nr:hypothetical protein [Ramalina farinacea]